MTYVLFDFLSTLNILIRLFYQCVISQGHFLKK